MEIGVRAMVRTRAGRRCARLHGLRHLRCGGPRGHPSRAVRDRGDRAPEAALRRCGPAARDARRRDAAGAGDSRRAGAGCIFENDDCEDQPMSNKELEESVGMFGIRCRWIVLSRGRNLDRQWSAVAYIYVREHWCNVYLHRVTLGGHTREVQEGSLAELAANSSNRRIDGTYRSRSGAGPQPLPGVTYVWPWAAARAAWARPPSR